MLVTMIPSFSFADAVKNIDTAGGELGQGTYTLSGNVDLTDNLIIPAGAKVTIDLNGHTLKGNGNSSVIVVNGELTIKDSSSGGKVTGGNALGSKGGGVLVKTGGSLQLLSGAITDNTAPYGGGVCVEPQATFRMDGGEISNNTSTNVKGAGGGGVAVEHDTNTNTVGSFTMNAGKISGNSSWIQGGGVFSAGTMIMNGGEISNNTAPAGAGIMSNYDTFTMNAGAVVNNTADCTKNIKNGGSFNNALGGGIKVANSKFYFYGGTVSGNKAVSVEGINMCDGGGIHVNKNGEIHVKGSPVVENNTNKPVSGDAYADNIYMQHSNVLIHLDGDLTGDAKLSVRKAGNVGQITKRGDYTFEDGTITADDPATKLTKRDGDLHFGTSAAEADAVAYTYVEGEKFYYASLEDAIADMASGENTVYLLKDIELSATVTASDKADLVLAAEEGKSIKITGSKVSGAFFNLPKGAKLTLLGDITLDGENKNVQAFNVQGDLIIGSEKNAEKNPAIKNFSYKGSGGAINVRGGTVTLDKGEISGNKANEAGSMGGAISATAPAIININGGSITGNSSTSYGGAISLNGSTLNITGGSITGNTAGNNTGEGIHANNGSVVNMTGGTINDNGAKDNTAEACQLSLNTSSAMIVDGEIGKVKLIGDAAYCFYTNGGTFENQAGLRELPKPVKAGYIFKGWYHNSDFSGAEAAALAAGTPYYAQWQAKNEQVLSYNTKKVEKHINDGAFTNPITQSADGGDVTYASSDEKIATVNENGGVTIVGAGTATITATAAETSSYKEAVASYDLIVTDHQPGDKWEHGVDGHWHVCKICKSKVDFAEHEFQWVVDKEATTTEKGRKHEKCTVCGYEKAAVEIPVIENGTTGGDQNSGNAGNSTKADTANGSKTGDAMPIGMLAVLMLAAAAGIAFCGRKLYKSR